MRLAARGEYAQAIPHARRWLEFDPLNEPAHRAAHPHVRLERRPRGGARAVPPLRADPEPGARRRRRSRRPTTLYEQVNDGTLSAPPEAEAALHPPPAAPAGVPPELPLVGRAEELAALVDAHARAEPDGGLAVIEGEAGIGKTRLAEELMASARSRGAVVLAARCHDDEAGLPYGPVVELLREAVTGADAAGWPPGVPPQRLADASLLLPELSELSDDVPDPLPLDGPGAQVRLLEGVAAVIAAACEGPQPAWSSSMTSTQPTRPRWTRSPTWATDCADGRCCSLSAGAPRRCHRGTGFGAWRVIWVATGGPRS